MKAGNKIPATFFGNLNKIFKTRRLSYSTDSSVNFTPLKVK